MRKENKRMLAVVLSAVCVLTAAGMDGSISVASTETRQTDSIEKTQTISSALASALEQIPGGRSSCSIHAGMASKGSIQRGWGD